MQRATIPLNVARKYSSFNTIYTKLKGNLFFKSKNQLYEDIDRNISQLCIDHNYDEAIRKYLKSPREFVPSQNTFSDLLALTLSMVKEEDYLRATVGYFDKSARVDIEKQPPWYITQKILYHMRETKKDAPMHVFEALSQHFLEIGDASSHERLYFYILNRWKEIPSNPICVNQLKFWFQKMEQQKIEILLKDMTRVDIHDIKSINYMLRLYYERSDFGGIDFAVRLMEERELFPEAGNVKIVASFLEKRNKTDYLEKIVKHMFEMKEPKWGSIALSYLLRCIARKGEIEKVQILLDKISTDIPTFQIQDKNYLAVWRGLLEYDVRIAFDYFKANFGFITQDPKWANCLLAAAHENIFDEESLVYLSKQATFLQHPEINEQKTPFAYFVSRKIATIYPLPLVYVDCLGILETSDKITAPTILSLLKGLHIIHKESFKEILRILLPKLEAVLIQSNDYKDNIKRVIKFLKQAKCDKEAYLISKILENK
ncbi:hypothetical protein O9G_004438 [Rozella allomycis CSF55]|uniref:Uncharacterized protein n=1 Tax=Rozella allomycis (strain CSF55) TaxID=988480 RepID=A0A075AU68_ROZAC|nr:hypothetical protein O9G_004438 [Rozella allomycis CSF55]|eukprot:EPZ33846.1 hypothetical protein O9G_004438 [Rozella allomycis CSF55]